MKSLGILLMLFLSIIILANITQAAPLNNPLVQVSTNTLQIETPPLYFIKLGDGQKFHIHVINQTRAKTNITTSCAMHLYNSTGAHMGIGNQWMDFDSNGFDFSKTVSGGNFSQLGYYAFVFQCNSTSEVGFLSGQLHVTQTGQDATTTNSLNFITTLVMFLIVSIFFLILGLKFENPAMKIIFIGISGIILFAALLFSAVVIGQTNAEYPDFVEGFATFLTVMKILMGIFIIALLISTIVFAWNTWMVKRGFRE